MKAVIPVILILFFILISPICATGQYYLSGTEGASVKWNRLTTDKYRIIYPKSDSLRALSYLFAMNRAVSRLTGSLQGDPTGLDIVLHSFSSRSNALTVWAPSRLEVFPVPPDDSYSQPWPDQLALHELRHVVQITSLNRGLTGGLASVFGEHVTGLVFGLHIPRWFAEGDAVYSETVFSESGRGRDPLFRMRSHAWAASSSRKSYNQLLFGSLKWYNPGAYGLGYEMVTRVRAKKGIAAWDSVMQFVAGRPWQPFAFSAGLKRITGLSTKLLFDSTLASFPERRLMPEGLIPKVDEGKHVDFYRPRRVIGGQIAAVRSVYGELTEVVLFDSLGGGLRQLVRPGAIIPESFDAKRNTLVWTEIEYHTRWEHYQYAVVWYHNLSDGSTQRLKPQTRWFMPTLSPDMKRLAVVEISTEGNEWLVIVDFPQGDEIQRLSVPTGVHLMSPEWMDSTTIAALVLDSSGKSLVTFDLASGAMKPIVRFGSRFVLVPRMIQSQLVLTTEHKGEAVLASLHNKSLTMLFSGGYGVHQASGWDASRFLCNVYTPNGYRVALRPIAPDSSATIRTPWLPEEEFSTQEKGQAASPVGTPDSLCEPVVERYRDGLHLFRFHSWAPVAVDLSAQEVKPGITLLSQNSLGTAATTLGYRYLESHGNHELFATFDYYRFFPVFGVGASVSRRATTLVSDQTTVDFSWSQAEVSFHSYVPLQWGSGNHIFGFTPAITCKGEWYRADEGAAYTFKNSTYRSLSYSVQLSHVTRSSVNDLYPPWGQVVYGLYRHAPLGGAQLGELMALEAWLYFPGALPHHGLKVYGGYEKHPVGSGYYSTVIDFPRGTTSYRLPHRWASSLTYAFPLARPDWDLGKLAFVKRLIARLFYDINYSFSRGDGTFDYQISSTGVELTAEGHLFRLVTPVSGGVRFSWLVEKQSLTVDILLNIRFDAF